MGVKPTLLTLDKLRDAPGRTKRSKSWSPCPGLTHEQIINTVSWMARGRRFDRIVALDEFDLQTAAQIREHMRIPGMGVTTLAYYRDKLAMRTSARARPAFWFRVFAACSTTTSCAITWTACPRPGCSSRAPRLRVGIRKIARA